MAIMTKEQLLAEGFTAAEVEEVYADKAKRDAGRKSRLACYPMSIMLELPQGAMGYLDGLFSRSGRMSINSGRQILRVNPDLTEMIRDYFADRFELDTLTEPAMLRQLQIADREFYRDFAATDWSDINIDKLQPGW